MAAAIAAAVRRRDAAENDSPKSEASLPAAAAAALKKSKSQAALDLPPYGSGFWRYQRQSAAAYTGLRVQLTVAALIAGNFLMNVIEKWIDPDGDTYPDLWVGADIFFNVSFAIELVWNMYSFWLWRFWKSAWNVFDVIVVTIGLMNLALPNLPGPLSLLRMMRAFRVFRLFKRVESLHKIIKSLSRAVPGVANAFLILLLVMSIYAILGVEFFGTYANGGNYTNEFDEVVEIITARELQFGYENFGSFHLSLFTMFQVLTGESWAEAVARPLLLGNNVVEAFGVAFFFVSFIVVNGVVLINVVVAVLLEKMVDDEKDPQEEEVEEDEEEGEEEDNNVKSLATAPQAGGEGGLTPESAEAAREKNWHWPMTYEPGNAKAWSPGINGDANGDGQAIDSETALGPQDGASTSRRIANLRADLDAMKGDMKSIQESMSVLMSLLNIPVQLQDGDQSPKFGEGLRQAGLSESISLPVPTASLPGSVALR
mmetsp:Transcript_28275/g.67252  ORF Transcript_28275/g.67252 Transcript_28275/m.67252 type:complete len:485 (+) Transcript_28275:18-1472(+)